VTPPIGSVASPRHVAASGSWIATETRYTAKTNSAFLSENAPLMFLSCRFGCFLSAVSKGIDITLPKVDQFFWRLANFQNVSLALLSQDLCFCVLLNTRL